MAPNGGQLSTGRLSSLYGTALIKETNRMSTASSQPRRYAGLDCNDSINSCCYHRDSIAGGVTSTCCCCCCCCEWHAHSAYYTVRNSGLVYGGNASRSTRSLYRTPGPISTRTNDCGQVNHKKRKGAYSSLWTGNPSQSYGASPPIWDHTVLPATRHR